MSPAVLLIRPAHRIDLYKDRTFRIPLFHAFFLSHPYRAHRITTNDNAATVFPALLFLAPQQQQLLEERGLDFPARFRRSGHHDTSPLMPVSVSLGHMPTKVKSLSPIN